MDVLINRRTALLRSLFGLGAVGLRAFASGIPAAILLNPKLALAQGEKSACSNPNAAQYLILNTSDSGDPINANVPGTYDDPKIIHSTDPNMAGAPLLLSGRSYTAATAWGQLPQAVLDRTVFFHHATYIGNHGADQRALTLNGAVKGNEMLASLIAKQNGPCLGTIQNSPICLAGTPDELLVYQGRVQSVISPRALARVLTLPQGPLSNLQSLRDSTLDKLNAWYKKQGIAAQQDFLDRYATSQTQLRKVSDNVLGALSSIKDDGIDAQIAAAIALIKMNIAPVMTIRINFGGDNHGDGGLLNEAAAHVSGIAQIASLQQALADAGLQDKVTFLSQNVFGRTLSMRGLGGRDHNDHHHVTVAIGAGFKGTLVGGAIPYLGDYGASPIDPQTGAASSSGQIPYTETFAAMGKTIACGAGLPKDFVDNAISGGQVVAAALKA